MSKMMLPFLLIPLLTVSCNKGENQKSSGNASNAGSENIETPTQNKPVNPPPLEPEAPLPPVNPPDFHPIAVKEKESVLHFGNGKLTLNNETSDFKIDAEINADFDYKNLVESDGIFDSTNYSISKSSLFPNDKHSFIKIPDKIAFDPIKSVDGKGSDDKYHIDIGIWGTVGNSYHTSSYLLCYKSFKGLYSTFEFAIDTIKYKNAGSCSEVAEKIQNNEVKKLPIKGLDFILLRVNGFRFGSYGDCTNNDTCRVFSNFTLEYYIEK
nr:hypothetical protein GTC16762_32670 [Pigmentibacter ruber]